MIDCNVIFSAYAFTLFKHKGAMKELKQGNEEHVSRYLRMEFSGVGGGGAGSASAPPKVLICQKYGQNP